MKRDDFVRSARSYIDTPFRHQGRLPGVGLDCAGVAVCAARECGEEVEDFLAYSRLPNASQFLETIGKSCDRVLKKDLLPGDLIVFEFDANPQHLAIVSGSRPLMIVHAYTPARKVVEHRADAQWMSKARAFFRIRGIE